MKKKNSISPVFVVVLLGGAYLFTQKQSGRGGGGGGNNTPPQERWYMVPEYGPTPESVLPRLGYVNFGEHGWYHTSVLQAEGWTYNPELRRWLPPSNWGAAEWLNTASQALSLTAQIIPAIGAITENKPKRGGSRCLDGRYSTFGLTHPGGVCSHHGGRK